MSETLHRVLLNDLNTMRKIRLMLVAMVIVIGATQMQARTMKGTSKKGKAEVNIYSNSNSATLNVILISEESGTTYIEIYNQKGEKVFSEKIKGLSSFRRPYDFKGMPKGEYRVEVSHNSIKTEKAFNFEQVYQIKNVK